MRLIALLLSLSFSAFPATYFVRTGASGAANGTSWTDAWANLSGINWSGKAAGDVICVAGGTYSGDITTGVAGSSGNPITIRRATVVDATCGSSTGGWSSGYDSQVVMSGTINLLHGYNTIDGSVANGIKVVMQNPSSDYTGVGLNGALTGVVLRYIEIAGPCAVGVPCFQNGDHRSINMNHWNGLSYDLQTNWVLSNLNIHGGCNLLWTAHSTGLIIEHSRFAENNNTDGSSTFCHANVMIAQDIANFTFRYNEVTQWEVEGLLFCPNGACQANGSVYGNIFWNPSGTNARVIESQYSANGPFLLYNNTFVKTSASAVAFGTCVNTANGGSFAAGTQGRNNISYGTSFANCGTADEDYNYSDRALGGEAHGQGSAANPFTNYAGGDFTLSAATSAGLTLSSPYNIDYIGTTRGAGGVWDRGAYEFGTGGSSGGTAMSGKSSRSGKFSVQ